jgi:pimeloyl-ACP methyl ester carboxylesterase
MSIANHVGGGRLLKLGLLGLILSFAGPVRPARADLLFFKDGFAIEGRVKREMTLEWDPVGREAFHVPKGFFFLDDGPRRIFFSPTRIRYVFEKDPPSEERITCQNPIPGQLGARTFPGLLKVLNAPKWNPNWSRRFQFLNGFGDSDGAPQHIGLLTPYWARVNSMGRYFWSCGYLTRELGPDTVKSLLATHPAFQENEKQTPAQRASIRLRKADFFAQAGWLDLADRELDNLVKEVPDQKQRVEAARKTLAKLRARDGLEEIKRRHLAGQHRRVRKLLADFPTQGVPKQQIAQLEELKAEYEKTDALLRETGRLLAWARKADTGADSAWLRDAAALIEADLNFENVARLDAFLGQARQAERLRKKGKRSEVRPEQLLSLAVSGWLLGSASAETSMETARRLWDGRDMVLTYLRSDDEDKRRQLLNRYLKASQAQPASLDELVQIIRTLPPIAAEKNPPRQATTYQAAGASYVVQLPPEYRHGRLYPVLIVLHDDGEKPSDMLDRWSAAAAEHGYVLVAPEWQNGGGNKYNFSEEEHKVVLGTLRDLRRRFNTDEDRVFLFGLGEGGNMAFDVGLGHPDLFAGVLPMSGAPQYHAESCWRNGQYLPFYVVRGNEGVSKDRTQPKNSQDRVRAQFNNWILQRFPMLWVDYKGRGVEWFAGEVQNSFDWMRGQRRYFPMQTLGTSTGNQFGTEFQTLRACDNRFYWLSCDDIAPRNIKTVANWKAKRQVPPADLSARILRDGNEVIVTTRGIRRWTLWLGRNNQGEDMIDFDRPLTVRHNLGPVKINGKFKDKVTPSLEVMLEDLYERGDRQQLFFAKITWPPPKQAVKK